MTWGRFDDRLARHCKYAPLSDAAFRLAIQANLWAREMTSDGFVPRNMLPSIVRFGGRRLQRAIEELETAGAPVHAEGIWKADGQADGWWIHDFQDYGAPSQRNDSHEAHSAQNAFAERSRVNAELSRKRAEAGRRGGMSRRPPPLAVVPATAEAIASKLPSKIESKVASFASSKVQANPSKSLDLDPKSNPERTPPKPPEAKHQANASSKPEAKVDCDVSIELPPIAERAVRFQRDRLSAEAQWGPVQQWPEMIALWSAFETAWGRKDEPRHGNDPRVRCVIQLYASGRSEAELVKAIGASKRYGPVAKNVEFQRLKTILKDEEQVDNLLRLHDSPQRLNGDSRPKQRGGWSVPATEMSL